MSPKSALLPVLSIVTAVAIVAIALVLYFEAVTTVLGLLE